MTSQFGTVWEDSISPPRPQDGDLEEEGSDEEQMVVDEVDCMDYEKTDSEFSYTSFGRCRLASAG